MRWRVLIALALMKMRGRAGPAPQLGPMSSAAMLRPGSKVAELEAATTDNFFRLFTKAQRAQADRAQVERPACA